MGKYKTESTIIKIKMSTIIFNFGQDGIKETRFTIHTK